MILFYRMIFIDRAPGTRASVPHDELHHQSWGSPSIAQGAIMDIQKRVAKYKESISPFLASRARIFLLAGRPLSPVSLSPFVRPRESTYGCSFGNHIFFVSQFAAPLNALPPFRRGCISVAAARYKFWRWLRALDGVGGKVGQGEKRRRKIGPMVIDYLPRIPRIPYSDRPEDWTFDNRCSSLLLLFLLLLHLLSCSTNSPGSVGDLVYFVASRDEGYNSRVSETLC